MSKPSQGLWDFLDAVEGREIGSSMKAMKQERNRKSYDKEINKMFKREQSFKKKSNY